MGMNRTLGRSTKGRTRTNDGRRHIRGIRSSGLFAKRDICVRRAIGLIERPVSHHCTPLASEGEGAGRKACKIKPLAKGRGPSDCAWSPEESDLKHDSKME